MPRSLKEVVCATCGIKIQVKMVKQAGNYCADCTKENEKEATRKYLLRNKDKIKKHKQEYNAKSRDKINAAQRLYREKHREELLKKRREYKEKNKERIKAVQKKYEERNKDKIAVVRKRWADSNPERIKINNKRYVENNRDKLNSQQKVRRAKRKNFPVTVKYKVCKKCGKRKSSRYFHRHSQSKDLLSAYCSKCNFERTKVWRLSNTEKINARARERTRNDTQFRLRRRIKAGFSIFMRGKKSKTFQEYVGYSYKELCDYLGDVPEGYSVDHIIPQVLYDYTKPEEIKKCWNMKNLRLLPLSENISKHDTLDMRLVRKHKIEHLLPSQLSNFTEP